MDAAGLTVLLSTVAQQQTAITADVAAMRTDVAKAVTKIEAADAARLDFEARLRIIEQRPSTVDLETRMRRLEAWRYALPTATLLGLGSAVASVLAVFHH